MDMHWLDDVLVLLEEGNMTRAAARRNITQPAFSRRIRAFEDWVGHSVIERKTNQIDISPALTAHEGEIRELLARLRDLRTKIAQYDPSMTTLAIAAQHAPLSAIFPEMAEQAERAFPGLSFRLRAGNLGDCVSHFLRGDTSLLLCYEAPAADPLQFGPEVLRVLWGHDRLVPVAGRELRYHLRGADIPEDTPAIVYPDSSFFGEVLNQAGCRFGTPSRTATPVCQTAFSSGTKEMVMQGLGIAWLPHRMVRRDLSAGTLVTLDHALGHAPLDIAIYARSKDPMAHRLTMFWARSRGQETSP